MGMFDKLVKGGAAMKAVQKVQHEAKKPENRKKINDAMSQLKKRRSGGESRPGT